MRDNITVATINTGRTATTEPIFQYDYGQILIIRGIELPTSYQVHFSNERTGNSQTMIGTGDGVEIPQDLIAQGRTIYAWIYLHTGLDDGETVYTITIPVTPRARIAEDTPTPEQQSAIDQAIAALNSAVEEVQEIAEGMEQQIDDALTEAKESGEFDGAPGAPGVGVPAGGSQGQVLAKRSGTDFDTEWVNQQGGSGGAVSSVNGETGDVVLDGTKVNVNNSASTPKTVQEELGDLNRALNDKPDVKESDAEDVDLDISDKDGNVILRLKSGHIYTKEFSSDSLDPGNNVPKVSASNATGVDLDVSDKYGNVIFRFKDGHIQTKEFDSETVVSAISILTDTVKKITDGYEELTASITYNASTTNTITITDSFVKGEEIWFHLEDGLEYWDYGQYASYYEGNTLFANNRRGTNGFFRHIVNADCSSVKITIPSNEYTNGTNLTLHVYRITGKIEPKVVTVKADGTGMFTTIRAAIDSITDANHLVNPYVIEVYPGTYNTLAGYSDEEIEAAGDVEHYTQTSMVGPKLTDGMSMRGVGRPDEIILTAELDPVTWSFEVRSEISTLNIQGEGNLENMTIIGKYIRYCVHDDFRAPVNSLDKRFLRNLIFKGTNLSYYPFMTTYGGGMSQPRDYLIENCDFGYDLGIHSNSGYAYGCTIEVNHCSGCRFRIGDAASASGDAVNRVIVNDCNFQVLKIAHNDLTIPSHMIVMGTGNEQSMVKDDTGTMYRLGMIDLFPAGQTAGLMVKRSSSGLGIEATSDSDVAIGIVIGSDSDYSYVQRCGYIASNYLGLTGLAVGDYVTVDNSTHLVTAGGTSSNAVGVVKAVDSDGIAYIQLTLKGE